MFSVIKRVLRNFAKFTGKHLSFLIEACNFIKKETLALVLSLEFYEISRNTFFTEQLWEIASLVLKLCLSTKPPHQEIRSNFGILHSHVDG